MHMYDTCFKSRPPLTEESSRVARFHAKRYIVETSRQRIPSLRHHDGHRCPLSKTIFYMLGFQRSRHEDQVGRDRFHDGPALHASIQNETYAYVYVDVYIYVHMHVWRVHICVDVLEYHGMVHMQSLSLPVADSRIGYAHANKRMQAITLVTDVHTQVYVYDLIAEITTLARGFTISCASS